MKRCPNCMKLTESRFCPDCGYDLSTVETSVCPKCGKESSSLFCPDCGTVMKSSAEPIMNDADAEATNPVDSSADVSVAGNDSGKSVLDILKKKPVIIGAAVAIVLLVLISSLGSGSNSGSTSSDVSTDSSSTVSVSDQSTAADNDYSSNSSAYSSNDDGMDLIQGYWDMKGVVTDGETTRVGGIASGSLVINGDQWEMTISTTETTVNSGTLYYDMSGNLESGGKYYVYTMKSGEYSGSVKMTYSADDNFIAVSTKSTLDADNCMMFGR